MNLVWAIALLVLSYAITALVTKSPSAPKVVDAQPSGLQDFVFPQHDEGTPQPVIFGDVWVEDWMVLYYGNLVTTAIRSESGGGGGKK